jgi:DNA-directed RNA polymerase beta subunit
MRPDQTSQTNALHYLEDGNVNFRFSWRKAEYLVPVMMILKALVETNDREIFEGLVGAAGSEGLKESQFVTDRVEGLLRSYKGYKLHSQAKTRAYLGSKFKPVLGLVASATDEEAGESFLRKVRTSMYEPHVRHTLTSYTDILGGPASSRKRQCFCCPKCGQAESAAVLHPEAVCARGRNLRRR